jgi:decaprenylphospho-beta-D-erythro-pentofuranosid-2-ulose 2-reductase
MNILVLGGNSDIGLAVAHLFAQNEKANIILASRDVQSLEKRAKNLAIRHSVKAEALFFDACDYDSHHDFYNKLSLKPDVVVVAFGVLGKQEEAQSDFNEAKKIIETSFLGAVSILELIAADFEKINKGSIIGISSVSGERGRKSNYIYGSAKGAFSIFLSGLRNRLSKKKIHVMTVLPGFVRTKMTQGMDLPEKLLAEPEEAALDIYLGYKKHVDILYTKWMWKYIMMIIKNIPEKVFKKTNI